VKKVAPLDLREQTPSTSPQRDRDLVLYVEDDDDNWDVAQLRLDQHHALLRAANSQEACARVLELGKRISMILMDIELRGSELNGVELTELFRGRTLQRELPADARGLPVVTNPIIFVTAHGARYSDVELMLFGVDLVVPKPVNFESLRLALTTLHRSRPGRGR
jgi:CheY-like chemotaxis protein